MTFLIKVFSVKEFYRLIKYDCCRVRALSTVYVRAWSGLDLCQVSFACVLDSVCVRAKDGLRTPRRQCACARWVVCESTRHGVR